MKTKHLLLSAIVIIALGWLADSYIINADKGNITEEAYRNRDEIQANSLDAQSAKGYMNWMKKIRVNPKTGTVSEKDLELARRSYQQNMRAAKTESDLNFEFMGPDDVGGRTRSLIVDNRDNKTLWAGGVSGGLWKSTTNGRAWLPIARDQFENLAISTICQSPDGTIYIGTGEAFSHSPNYIGNTGTVGFPGCGIIKSTDGVNFSVLEATNNNDKFRYINELAFHNGKLYAATNNSLWVSEDEGATWNKPFFYTEGTTDVKVAPSGKIIFVHGNKVYVTDANGENPVNKQTQFDTGFNRIELAIAPSDENIMYALCSYDKYVENKYFNFYRSEDGGNTWTSMLEQHTSQVDLFRNRTQGDYDNILAVYPDNPNKVLLGGIDLWVWNYGSAFEQISIWYGKGSPKYVHADHHDIVFHPNFLENQTIYFTNDGGIFETKDNCLSFKSLNKNYNVTQYYAIDCGPNGEILGGTQDNGTPYINLLQPTDPKGSIQFTGGDGGYTAISKLYPGAIFSTIYYSKLMRSNENGLSSSTLQENPFDSHTRINLKPGNEYAGNPFVTPIAMWESFNDENSKIFIPFVIDTIVRTDESGIPQKISSFKEGFVFSVPSSVVDNKEFYYTVTAEDLAIFGRDSLLPGDTLPVREKYTNLMAIGGGGQIFFTREALNFKNEYPNWDAVVGLLKEKDNGEVIQSSEDPRPLNLDLGVGEVNHLVWSADGDALYAIAGKKVFRFTGFQDAYNYEGLIYANQTSDTTFQMGVIGDNMAWIQPENGVFSVANIKGKMIYSFDNQGTSIAIDPKDVNKLVITCGGFGSHNKVFYSENALSDNPNFVSIDGNLPQAPVYASIISDTADVNQNLILLGTEYGIYSTTSIENTSTNWLKENSMPNLPVFHFVQQRHPNGYLKGVGKTGVRNSGVIYAATHGSGIWKLEKFARPYTGLENIKKNKKLTIDIYPNPAQSYFNIAFESNKPETLSVQIYTLTGKMVQSEIVNTQIGESNRSINISSLNKGVYVVLVSNGISKKTQKLIVQ